VGATAKLRVGDTEVTRIGLGTNRLTNSPDGAAFVRDAVAAGIEHIDAARLYTGGESEQAIGAALSPFAASCVVATKGGYGGARRGRPDALRAEIEESLRSLRTEAIPLYYLHRVDPETPLEESLGAIKEFVDAGQIRHVGLSEVTVDQIESGRQVVPIAAVQNEYNLSEREHDEVIDYCAGQGIPFMPFFPLRGDEPPELAVIADRHGATRSQITLAWLLRRSPTMLPIPGTLSLEHVKKNLGALEIDLTDDEFESLR
jgi:pyridoxine 4-dehydrogenase